MPSDPPYRRVASLALLFLFQPALTLERLSDETQLLLRADDALLSDCCPETLLAIHAEHVPRPG